MGLFELVEDSWIRWRARRLGVTPLEHVSDGARVKVVGRADPGDQPLTAPISGRPCAAWNVEVQEGPGWETIFVEQQAQDFVLRDGSPRPALVRAARASIAFESDAWVWQRQHTDRMLALLARHHVPATGYFGAPMGFRYVEGVIEAGEEITIVGTARLEIDPSGSAGSYREPPMRARFDVGERAPLWILDGPARWRLG